MIRWFHITALALGLLGAAPLDAHPHVFIRTDLRLVLDGQGDAIGVEVRWRYDELYSMLLFEDMGLDPDYDGVLSAEAVEVLQGFDLNWVKGFAGDLYVSDGAGSVALGAPQDRGTRVEDAQIVSSHFRPFEGAPSPGALRLRAYDPWFYTAYELAGVTAPATCRAQIERADIDAASAGLAAQIAALPREVDAEAAGFPEVGAAFADTAVIRCG